jgi:hypothetical protein
MKIGIANELGELRAVEVPHSREHRELLNNSANIARFIVCRKEKKMLFSLQDHMTRVGCSFSKARYKRGKK